MSGVMVRGHVARSDKAGSSYPGVLNRSAYVVIQTGGKSAPLTPETPTTSPRESHD